MAGSDLNGAGGEGVLAEDAVDDEEAEGDEQVAGDDDGSGNAGQGEAVVERGNDKEGEGSN